MEARIAGLESLDAGLITRQQQPFNAETPLELLAQAPTPTSAFYVRCNFDVPQLDTAAWRLRIGGAVRKPIEITYDELQRLPRSKALVLLECAGNGRRRMVPTPPGVAWDLGAAGTAWFEGVRLAVLLEQCGLDASAVEVVFRGADSGEVEKGRVIHFERSLPVQDALSDDVLIADTMNGAPLTPLHGYPVRLVVPRWYAVASVKWLSEITVLDRPFEGHFQHEKYRYFNDPHAENGSPVRHLRVRSIITSHRSGDVVGSLPIRISGLAWSGAAEVAGVDVSTDGGQTWQPAQLKKFGPYAPAAWYLDWTPSAGQHTIISRARDAAGHTQPLEPLHNELGYGNNVVQAIELVCEK